MAIHRIFGGCSIGWGLSRVFIMLSEMQILRHPQYTSYIALPDKALYQTSVMY